jgi:hypothetical protein
MKLEKREITLNEEDSIKDVFYLQKTLLHEYVYALTRVETKARREEVEGLLRETLKDATLLRELMK